MIGKSPLFARVDIELLKEIAVLFLETYPRFYAGDSKRYRTGMAVRSCSVFWPQQWQLTLEAAAAGGSLVDVEKYGRGTPATSCIWRCIPEVGFRRYGSSQGSTESHRSTGTDHNSGELSHSLSEPRGRSLHGSLSGWVFRWRTYPAMQTAWDVRWTPYPPAPPRTRLEDATLEKLLGKPSCLMLTTRASFNMKRHRLAVIHPVSFSS